MATHIPGRSSFRNEMRVNTFMIDRVEDGFFLGNLKGALVASTGKMRCFPKGWR
jgi:hypothetical protein